MLFRQIRQYFQQRDLDSCSGPLVQAARDTQSDGDSPLENARSGRLRQGSPSTASPRALDPEIKDPEESLAEMVATPVNERVDADSVAEVQIAEPELEPELDFESFDKKFQVVEEVYASQKWQIVVDHCQSLLPLNPSYAPTYKFLGNALHRLRRVDEARTAYEQALEYEPEFAEVHINLGNLDAQVEQWDDAIAHYQQAIAINPELAGAYRNLAKVWTRKGNERLATECLFHAIEQEPDSLDGYGYFKLGNQLLKQGQPKQAIHCYHYLMTEREARSQSAIDQRIDQNLDFSLLHQNLAEALAQTSQWQEAVTHYQQVQQLRHGDAHNAFVRGKSVTIGPDPQLNRHLENGHLANGPLANGHPVNGPLANGPLANRHPANSLALSPSHPVASELVVPSPFQKAQALAQQGQWAQVVDQLQQELKEAESGLNQRYDLLARAFRMDGNVDGAMEYYQKMLVLYPNQAKPFANLGSLYAQQERWQDATTAYQQAIQLDPNFAGAYRNLARVWQSVGNEDAAADCWVKAHELEPNWGDALAHLELGRTLVKRGKGEAAIASFHRALDMGADGVSCHLELAQLHQQQGDDEKAAFQYAKAINAAPEPAESKNVDAIYQLGELLLKNNQVERAIACFRRLIELDSKAIRGYARLRDIFVAQNQLDRALPCLQWLAELQPESSDAHHELGEALNQLERWQEAVLSFQRAIELNPDFSWSYNNLGDAYIHLKNWTEARAVLEKNIALNPSFFWAHHNLGRVQNELGNWSGAVEALQQAIALDPNIAWSHYNLGRALAQLNHLEEAVAAYRQAKCLDPGLDGLNGKIIEVIQQRIKRHPQRVDLYLEMADLWLDDENLEEAIATYQMVLHIAPHNRTVALALAQLLEKQDGTRSRSLRDRALIPHIQAASITSPKQLQDLSRVRAVLAATSLFDASYYRSVYNISEDDDPFEHYLTQGAALGYNPNPLFDGQYYGQNNPEIEEFGINPLAHYYVFGRSQQRNPHPLFSHERYLEKNSDIAATDICLLDHYLSTGAKQGRIAFGKETLEHATPAEAPYLKCLQFHEATSSTKDVGGRDAAPVPDIVQQVFGIFCNSEGNYFITEIADHIAASLERVGHQVLRLSEADPPPEQLDQTIIVAPHEFFFIGEQNDWAKRPDWWTQAIMVNVEQPQTQWFSKAFHFLRRSRLILDINVKSAALLHSFNLPVQWLPLGYLDGYTPFTGSEALPDLLALRSLHPAIRASRPPLAGPLSDRPLDLNFVGVLNRRRERFFAQNAFWLSQYRNVFHIPSVGDPLIAGEGQSLNTDAVIGLSRRSKILLNIHRDDVPYFEWHRIVFHGLWQNTLVVTEPCHDVPGLVPNIHFIACELDAMQSKIDWLLHTSEGQAQAEAIRWAGHTTLKRFYSSSQIMNNAAMLMSTNIVDGGDKS